MHFFRSCFCLLLLITKPVSFLDASEHKSKDHYKSIVQEKGINDLQLWTYDEILRLLDEIESGKLENDVAARSPKKLIAF